MRRADWVVREAIRDDLINDEERLNSLSMRAWVLEARGKLIGIGGVFLKKGAWTVFVKVIAPNDVTKTVLVRAMKIGFGKILSMKLPTLCAIKDKELVTADNLLNHFGFRHVSTADGEDVYICQK